MRLQPGVSSSHDFNRTAAAFSFSNGTHGDSERPRLKRFNLLNQSMMGIPRSMKTA